MNIASTIQNGLAIDPNSLGDLRKRAIKDPEGTLKEAATQFASLLMDQMVKSLRATAPSNGMFDNEGTRTFTELLDHEFAQKLAHQSGGLGLADMLVKQLSPAVRNHGQEIPKSADK